MSALFIFFSVFFALLGYVVYIAGILRGIVKPHRTTRFVVMVITTLAATSILVQGSVVAIWLAGVFALGSLIIFLLSMPYGMGGWGRIDVVCLVISLVGILLWKITADPVYALFAAIGADLAGQIPMLIKTYHHPETESWMFYSLDVLASICTLAAIRSWTIQEFAYPLYLVGIDGITVYLILRRSRLAVKAY